MVAFRRSLWLLVLVLMTSAMASAQIVAAMQCVANAGVPPIVPAEKLAAQIGDLVLNCNGGTPTASGAPVPQANVQIFLNTNVTSRLLADPWSEALLIIDEPGSPSNPGAPQLVCGASTAPLDGSGTCPIAGTGTGAGTYSGAGGVFSGTPPTYVPLTARPNVFQGRQSGANSLVWLGVPIDPPGTTFTRVIRITNVRANANQLGVSSTLIPTQIVAFISITGATSVPINNPQQTVAFIQNGLSFSVRAPNGDSSSGEKFLQCRDLHKDLSTDNTKSGCPAFRLRYAENFATAFLIRNLAGPVVLSSQAVPGAIYNTETMFFNPAFPTISGRGNLQLAGVPDQGTRLLARFNNVPAGVRLYVSIAAVASTGSTAAQLTQATSTGEGAYNPIAGTGTIASGCIVGTSGAAIAEVALSGGTGTAVWEVTTADPLQIGRVDFGVIPAWTSNTTAGLPGLGTATVNGSYAPISTVTTASGFAVPVPRFADTSSARNAFTINTCVTNLLYPFVTNQAGFDTGLVVSNTSRDPFGTPTQTGACRINYYGSTAGGGAAPAAQTSSAIPAGEQLVWTLSGGGNFGVTATPGFQGYIIAQCNFQFAHGYAFISDVGARLLAQGYLALVMDDGVFPSRTGSVSEWLAH